MTNFNATLDRGRLGPSSYWGLPRGPLYRDAEPTNDVNVPSPSEFVASLVLVATAAVAGPALVALAPVTVMLPIGVVLASGLGATGMLALRHRIRKWVGVRGGRPLPRGIRPTRPME